MLSMRLKGALCTERVVICSIFSIIVLAVFLAVVNAKTKTFTISSFKGTGAERTIGDSEYEAREPSKRGPTSKAIADGLIKDLLGRIGDGKGPFIVGGIGDSGTRGMRDVMIHLGAQMLGEGYVNPISKDSEVYMDTYETTTSGGRTLLRSPPSVYNPAIVASKSLKYNSTMVPFEMWNCGRQYVAKMVSRSMSISEKFRGRGNKLEPWGFKHPRTSLLMPFWVDTLKDKFVFVHVLRDGKDIVEGDNQKLFRDTCVRYYGGAKPCINSLQNRINFWADLNRDIFEFVLESRMKAHQYIAIRIEDLVAGNEACYRRLAHYMGLTSQEMQERLLRTIAMNRGHESSYFGNKWSPELKVDVEKAMKYNKHTLKDFDFWGYKADEYKLTKDCESLDWIRLLRAKKGPLPGDEASPDHIMTSTPTTLSQQNIKGKLGVTLSPVPSSSPP